VITQLAANRPIGIHTLSGLPLTYVAQYVLLLAFTATTQPDDYSLLKRVILSRLADRSSPSVLAKRHDDFSGAGVGADVLVSCGVFPQPIENAIDGRLEDSGG